MKETNLEELARQIKNEKAREWSKKNRDKVKAINHRYWLKKARELLEERKEVN